MIKSILQVILVCDAILMVTLILLQNRGVALSQTFGGGDSSVNYQRRGSEKVLFYFTIMTALVFVSTSFAMLFVN
ncbi:preprotein translocase subunit SecG [Patescibacteria group bacterium]|nr:preprotein translocase subunit SecG [Patescibacteria group bacterium]